MSMAYIYIYIYIYIFMLTISWVQLDATQIVNNEMRCRLLVTNGTVSLNYLNFILYTIICSSVPKVTDSD